ncbi:LytR/AlgR family response regulator transcription factor [Hanstruepera flava]|uniref:LytR/AlgR family response regulator transcription factor n=1 Tax=Hanstruepera flava TaxID=2930218 RepID=UPI002027F53E|nr:LytTR family DNA-binding domain-containing protein [Hanstruepera flava]
MIKTINISNPKRTILIVLGVIIIGIVFESYQQLYYINRYQLSADATFFGLLKFQALRWIVWLLLSFFLIDFSRKMALKNQVTTKDLLKYALLIIGLVVLGIFSISILQLLFSDTTFSLNDLFLEFIPFFTFQKAPIYTLGYIAIAIILYFHFKNEQLQVEVQRLEDLKQSHAKAYKDLKSKMDDKAQILNIKIGNSHKIIAVDTINWIESDDYCVKVHTSNGSSYSMRSSLKALEQKLNGQFLRIHRKAIVNMDKVKSLNNSNQPNLIIQDETSISISKSNLKKVKDYLNEKS